VLKDLKESSLKDNTFSMLSLTIKKEVMIKVAKTKAEAKKDASAKKPVKRVRIGKGSCTICD